MADFPLDISLGDQGVFTIANQDDVQRFARDEIARWQFVTRVYRQTNADMSELNRRHTNFVNQLTSAINSSTNPESVLSFLTNAASPSGLVFSDSPVGQYVQQLLGAEGERVAVGCLCTLLGLRLDASDPEQLRGAIAADRFRNQVGAGAPDAVRQSISSMFQQAEQELLELRRLKDELARIARRIAERNKRHLRAALKSGRSARRQLGAELSSEARQEIELLIATRRAYEEHMGLEAPSQYWATKASEHKKSSELYRNVGLIYAAVCTVLVGVVGLGIYDFVLNAVGDKLSQRFYFVVGTVLAIVTILFWLGRLLSRLYLSERHLATDAEERSVMAQTFLALTRDAKIGDAERPLVLQALFRASSDGIVRDDGAPDFGFAALASRLGLPDAAKP